MNTSPTIVAEGGLVSWINEQVGQVTGAFEGILYLIAIIIFILTAWKARTMVSVIMGFACAAVFVWAGNNIDFGSDKIKDQVNSVPAPEYSTIQVVDVT